MKRLSLAFVLLALALSATAGAKDPDPKSKPLSEPVISPGEVNPTPEMWFYQQYQLQHKDPHALVQHQAELRAAERAHRIASMQWYGMSNSRPRASNDPFNNDYGPSWTSGNRFTPNRWDANIHSTVVIFPRESIYR